MVRSSCIRDIVEGGVPQIGQDGSKVLTAEPVAGQPVKDECGAAGGCGAGGDRIQGRC